MHQRGWTKVLWVVGLVGLLMGCQSGPKETETGSPPVVQETAPVQPAAEEPVHKTTVATTTGQVTWETQGDQARYLIEAGNTRRSCLIDHHVAAADLGLPLYPHVIEGSWQGLTVKEGEGQQYRFVTARFETNDKPGEVARFYTDKLGRVRQRVLEEKFEEGELVVVRIGRAATRVRLAVQSTGQGPTQAFLTRYTIAGSPREEWPEEIPLEVPEKEKAPEEPPVEVVSPTEETPAAEAPQVAGKE